MAGELCQGSFSRRASKRPSPLWKKINCTESLFCFHWRGERRGAESQTGSHEGRRGGRERETHLRSQTRIEIHPYNPPHLYAQFPIGCLRMESDVSASITDLSVADCAEGLQVVQGALPSSTRHGLDVVHLPEMPFPWVSYQLIKL